MFGWCEFVPTEAPLEGELAAELTEGSRLGPWPSLAPEAQIPGFLNIRVCIPPPAEAFLKKSRTPQTRRTPGQLRSALRVRKPRAATASIPSRGATGLYEFARFFSFRQSVPPSSTAEAVSLLQGEGYWLPSGGIRATGNSLSIIFGRLVAAPTWVCGWYEFARGSSASVLRTAPHPPPCSGGTFPGGEGYKASPPGKVMRGFVRIVHKKLYIF